MAFPQPNSRGKLTLIIKVFSIKHIQNVIELIYKCYNGCYRITK